jgi:hypothetical protein
MKSVGYTEFIVACKNANIEGSCCVHKIQGKMLMTFWSLTFIHLRNDKSIQGVYGRICHTHITYVTLYGHNQKYWYLKVNSLGDNGERRFKEWAVTHLLITKCILKPGRFSISCNIKTCA